MSIGSLISGFGQIRNLGKKKIKPFSKDFAYTGKVEEYVIPETGIYKLEVWGGRL